MRQAEIPVTGPRLRALLRIALLLAVVWPAPASADSKPAPSYWFAAARNSFTVQWGRLALKDGMLTFHTERGEWTTPLYEIKRIVRVKDADDTFEIVTASGATLQLTILGAQLLPESPRKAMQTIERAVRQAPVPAVNVTTDFRPVRR